MSVDIVLTQAELMQAATAGAMRRVSSMEKLLNKKHAGKSDWEIDIDGAAGEMAFAKSRNLYWSASNGSFKEPDVGDWQVRSSGYPTARLILRPNDSADARYVLVITDLPKVRIIGWMYGAQAREDCYWGTDAWWVPQADLTGF